MSFGCKLLLWLFLSMFLAARASAHEIDEGTGIVCDSPGDIELFAAFTETKQALAFVNAEKNVCVVARVRYIRGREMHRIHAAQGAVQIVEILVVEVYFHTGWGSVPPEIQYTMFTIEEEGA